jgi:hypothetical protein
MPFIDRGGLAEIGGGADQPGRLCWGAKSKAISSPAGQERDGRPSVKCGLFLLYGESFSWLCTKQSEPTLTLDR